MTEPDAEVAATLKAAINGIHEVLEAPEITFFILHQITGIDKP